MDAVPGGETGRARHRGQEQIPKLKINLYLGIWPGVWVGWWAAN